MRNRIVEGILSAVILGVITFFSNLMLTDWFIEKSVLTIGDSVEIDNETYLLPITINTFEKEINNLRIGFPGDIKGNQIKANIPLEINKIETEKNYSIIELTGLSELKSYQLTLIAKKYIEPNSIVVHKNGNKIKVNYSINDLKSPIKEQIKFIVINSLIYAGLIFLISLYQEKRRSELIKQNAESINSLIQGNKESLNNLIEDRERLQKSQEKTNKDLEKLDLEFKEINSRHAKLRLLYNAKLNDYSKELNFWRNTIRRILYQLPDGKSKAEEVIKSVSSALKTQQTHGNIQHDFENLKILSKYLSDNDKNEG
ncbi:hypothetical protein ACFFF5_10875 [Lederbergia wuyishanensis]|uniref:Uncharacterized protein n=1 Tax=Lederbergia wuyishanensis TaxID=1347903 RepID=A0ABU0D4F2_9BACI|nr:hypothetical protein [Lederbergia wuyishanensis]MCJ8008131.1 hypothetical protein [Lederbergia wuyishanensis]MDQ0343283.1 hypothetical protein [Lederbergia wuyishanensis]